MRTSGGHKQVHLYHFKAAEFNRAGLSWYPMMCPRLLILLDVLRTMTGPVTISGALGAVGRRNGEKDTSQHNVDRWGEVRAVDCFASCAPQTLLNTATSIGITGIGIYPEWLNNKGQKQYGVHLDTRRDKRPGSPATWGQVNGEWTSIDAAIAACHN